MSYEGSLVASARLPLATASVVGGVKVGSNLSLSSGTVSLSGANVTGALGYTPVNKAGDAMTGALTLAADPTNALDAATKQYVDSVAQGLDVKASCRAVATSNITLSGTQTIDGVAVVAGDRVLVTGQTTGSANGIYVVAASSWLRAADADSSAEVTAGLFVFVTEGTSFGDTGWVLTSNDAITLGTTALTFSQFSGPSVLLAGAGLTKTGNTVDVVAADTTITVNADSIQVGSNSLTNTHISTSAAIAYSKLNLTGAIVNADISASAAIADSKLATISTAGKVSDSALSSNVVLKNAAATFTGASSKLTVITSATTGAGLNVPHGAAPTTPANGDVWTTTGGLFARINGSTVQFGTGTGSVTSVGLSLPSIFTVSGSPVTNSGTLSATLASQTANTVFAAPNGSAGAPAFRAIAAADLPTATTSALGVAQAGTGLAVSSGVFSVDLAASLRTVRVVTAAGAVTCTAADDVVIVNKTTGAATAVTLPSTPATGEQITIKDGKGDASTNNITISAAAGNIDGAASHVIDGDYGSRTFVYNGTQWNLI